MRDLADCASMSHYTSYNLIGGKGSILYTLLHRSIDRIIGLPSTVEPEADPIRYIFDLGDAAVYFYVSDPMFYRPLTRYLFGVLDHEYRPAFMRKGEDHWRTAAKKMAAAAGMPDGLSEDDFGTTINTYFSGALGLWAHEEIEDAVFFAHIRQAISITLLAWDKREWREVLLSEIAQTRSIIHATPRLAAIPT